MAENKENFVVKQAKGIKTYAKDIYKGSDKTSIISIFVKVCQAIYIAFKALGENLGRWLSVRDKRKDVEEKDEK